MVKLRRQRDTEQGSADSEALTNLAVIPALNWPEEPVIEAETSAHTGWRLPEAPRSAAAAAMATQAEPTSEQEGSVVVQDGEEGAQAPQMREAPTGDEKLSEVKPATPKKRWWQKKEKVSAPAVLAEVAGDQVENKSAATDALTAEPPVDSDAKLLGSKLIIERRLDSAGAPRPERRAPREGMSAGLQVIKAELHQRILQEMALRPNWTRSEARGRVLEIVDAELNLQKTPLRRQGERAELIESLLNDVFGLGAIQKLIDDPGVSEIMVNGPNEVFVERSGRVYMSDIKFDSADRLMSVIDRIVGSVGRRVDESFPMVDARLADGSRVNVILPPLALRGACLTIRKFREEHYTSDQLIEMGAASKPIMDFLQAAVRGKANILITGGTSSGKTTLLNIISSFIGDQERIVTIEDAAELRLAQRHVVPLETRPPNNEGKGTITIRDLVKNSLRMRPDRLVVGEVRGPEALDMIQAMNTGHDGSMSTLHANSSVDALQRLEAMAMMAGVELPSESIRFQICSAITLVVHTERVSGGARKIVDVSEVLHQRGEMATRSIFNYRQSGVDEHGNAVGIHGATGLVPTYLSRIRDLGGVVDDEIFKTAILTDRRLPAAS